MSLNFGGGGQKRKEKNGHETPSKHASGGKPSVIGLVNRAFGQSSKKPGKHTLGPTRRDKDAVFCFPRQEAEARCRALVERTKKMPSSHSGGFQNAQDQAPFGHFVGKRNMEAFLQHGRIF